MQFIPILEDTGLIVPVGEWILRSACACNRAWQDAGLPRMRMAVNLSARQFRDAGLADTVERVLRDTGLAPEWLELEITESMLMDDSGRTNDVLQRLNTLGVHLTIDDFGTGYSSLGYLKRLPIGTLKIDRSFVKDATTSASDAALVHSIIAMAHGLGLRVVAEGVETPDQALFLREQACDEMQGYFFSRPLPAADLRTLLEHPAPAAVKYG
jgi:EAL domain-containing protein (putative c-di-GMP-specific phosphodiesterase class I)